MIKLPCTNCGHNLNIVRGAVIKCFACGTRNVYQDSYDELTAFVQDVLGYPKAVEEIEKKEIDEKELDIRRSKIDDKFNELVNMADNIEDPVVTKLYREDTEKIHADAVKLSKEFGMLRILIDTYLMPHLKGIGAERYGEMAAYCGLYQLAFLGLRHTAEAKESYKPEEASELYGRAAWNFEKAAELADEFSSGDSGLPFIEEGIIFSVCADFCGILAQIVDENPAHFSDALEELMEKLEGCRSFRANYLYSDIEEIYSIANELPRIMEEVRRKKPVEAIDSHKEKILYHTEEILEQIGNAKIWLKDVEDRFKFYQGKLMLLHCGRRIDYLKVYRDEFSNRLKKAVEIYNGKIAEVIDTALLDYTISASDLLEEMDSGMRLPHNKPADIVEIVRLVKNDLLELDSEVRNFLFEIIKHGIGRDLAKEFTVNIVSTISDKHSSFDMLIYRYCKTLLDKFIEERDKMRYTIEEQRDKLNMEIRPILDNLVRLSFTLKAEDIPLPVFIELILLTTTLEVEKEYKVFFVIENPCPKDINDVAVSFFVPNNFRIKTRFYDIKRLKPGQRINVETRIIPTEPGIYPFMAMVSYEYNYTHDLFWMPSITFKLKVLEPDEAAKTEEEDKLLEEIYRKYGKSVNLADTEGGKKTGEIPGSETANVDGSVPAAEETAEKITKERVPENDLLPDI